MKLTKTLSSLLIGFFLSILVFAGSIYFTYKTEENLHADFIDVEKTHQIIQRSKTITNTLTRMESNMRGYGISDDISFIDDYQILKDSLNRNIVYLENALAGNISQTDKMEQLKEVIKKKLASLDRKQIIFSDSKVDQKSTNKVIFEGKSLMDNIDRIQDDIISVQQTVLQQRHNNTVRDLRQTHITIEIIGSSAIIMSILIIIFFFEYAKTHARIEQDLIELNDNKNKFFSIISHDLRNPVKNIVLMAQLLTEQANSKSYDPLKIATMIQGSANNLSSLLDNLLKWSRLQMNKIEFIPEKLDMQKVVEDVIRHQAVNAGQKNIVIKNHIDKNVYAYVDQNMITTVLRNLISNGIKFTNKAGNIDIYAHSSDNDVEIAVTDNGVGMPSDIAEKIFSIDFKHSTKGTNKEEGTGLGLKLCKEFIEKNGGKIRVESQVNVGSKFIVTLHAARFVS